MRYLVLSSIFFLFLSGCSSRTNVAVATEEDFIEMQSELQRTILECEKLMLDPRLQELSGKTQLNQDEMASAMLVDMTLATPKEKPVILLMSESNKACNESGQVLVETYLPEIASKFNDLNKDSYKSVQKLHDGEITWGEYNRSEKIRMDKILSLIAPRLKNYAERVEKRKIAQKRPSLFKMYENAVIAKYSINPTENEKQTMLNTARNQCKNYQLSEPQLSMCIDTQYDTLVSRHYEMKKIQQIQNNNNRSITCHTYGTTTTCN